MSVVVLWGPPCSGKTTHIAERAQPADVVIDLDRIALALAPDGIEHHAYAQHHRDLARMARAAIVDKAAAWGAHQDLTVWIIDSNASAAARRRWRGLGAQVVKLNVPMAECLRRAETCRPAETQQLIREWFTRHAVPA
jgi:predicted kinase